MRGRFLILGSLWCVLVLASSPLAATADEPAPLPPDPNPPATASVLITEVQTGIAVPTPGTRVDEFIELYNNTNDPLDLTGWQLRYITASATSTKNVEDPSSTITLAPPLIDGEVTRVAAGENYLLHSGTVAPPGGVVAQQYAELLPATGGSLVLVRPDEQTCKFVVDDALAWGTATHLFGEGEALTPGSSSAKDQVLQRFVTEGGLYVDTSNNAADFANIEASSAGATTPGQLNLTTLPPTPPTGSRVSSQIFPQEFTNPNCTLPRLEPEPEPIPEPEPAPNPDPAVESPPSTTEPTPDPTGPTGQLPEEEVDTDPTIPPANLGLKTPLMSELLPNPAAPQTDADDEFVELYNPNDATFDLSGYALETGLTTTHHYTFPTGTSLPGKSFLAVFSADSDLTLSNTAGQARLIDPLGSVLAQSDEYAAAKDGQVWLLVNGSWQWATKPTPNAINIVSAPVVKKAATAKVITASTTKKTIAKKATPEKTSTAKTSKTTTSKKSSKAKEDAAQPIAAASTTPARSPLHPGVLVAVAASALLYGAYEYRHDLANKFAQFRSNRAARAALRQSPERR